MAPEQARGHGVDARADVFALGAVTYRALTGRPAFTGVDTPQLLFSVVYQHPKAPSALAPDVPRAVDAVMAVALAKRAADRFDHATEFAEALAADARIQHVAGQEVDEIHGAFPVSERAGRLAEHIAFEYRKFFGIMFELFELTTDESR